MSRNKTTQEFIEKSISVHGNKYDYSLSKYVNNYTKLKIICKEHGVFEQNANNHYNNKGCPKCGNKKIGKTLRQKASVYKNEKVNQPLDYKLIPLSKSKFAKIDNDDFEKIKSICWHFSSNSYAYNRSLGLMHRYIMNCPDGVFIDHINHDKLDNRKSNLRYCDRTQNAMNLISNSITKTSLYKGVHWDSLKNNWVSQIVWYKKHFVLGRFSCELEAAKAYDAKAKELFGEFAYLNFK